MSTTSGISGSLQTKTTMAGKTYFYMVITLHDNKKKWIATGLEIKNNRKKAKQMLRETIYQIEHEAEVEAIQEVEQYIETHNAPIFQSNAPTRDFIPQIVPATITFSNAVREWLEGVEIKVDEITLQGYQLLAKSHILPYFDSLGILLVDVTRQVLQTYINEKYKSGRLDGTGGLSPASIRHHKNIIYQVLTNAVVDGLIPSNPCAHIALPQQQRYESSFYTVEQLNTMLDAIREEPLYPLIKTTSLYGLRRSEVLGLKWNAIDFTNNMFTIKSVVCRQKTIVEKDKTKNKSSYRSFPLFPEIRNLLLELKEQEQVNRQGQGSKYTENIYVFKWSDGKTYKPDYISHKFSQLLEKHGLPHIRFHELRHSCASLLISMGFSLKEVQSWLGHADIQMTANTYGHIDTRQKRAMADKMGAAIASKLAAA
jgi:integrase